MLYSFSFCDFLHESFWSSSFRLSKFTIYLYSKRKITKQHRRMIFCLLAYCSQTDANIRASQVLLRIRFYRSYIICEIYIIVCVCKFCDRNIHKMYLTFRIYTYFLHIPKNFYFKKDFNNIFFDGFLQLGRRN